MSGFWRNLITVLLAMFRRDTEILKSGCKCAFLIGPLDVGVFTLKSDKYLQLAESAQLDFAVRSGLMQRMLRSGCSMVNVSQHIQFDAPLKLFQKASVQTSIVFADTKFVYFQHEYTVKGYLCATAVVKAKFKVGRITQSALHMTGLTFTAKPSFLN